MLTQDNKIILNGLISVSFISELNKNKFIESDCYNNMNFNNSGIKDYITFFGIDNQGMLLMLLYSLLLIPKEKIYTEYKSEYDKIDEEIDGFKILGTSTYSSYESDNERIEHIKHIRNAIAHGRVEATVDSIIFQDKYNNFRYSVEIPNIKIGFLLTRLEKIIYEYIQTLI